MKRVISLLLIVVLCLQGVVFAEISDELTEKPSYEYEAKILSELGILQNDLIEYKPYEYISNYDFLKMLAEFNDNPLNDFDEYVKILGINGGKRVGKHVYAKGDFALKAMLKVLGYDGSELPFANNENWYLDQARRIGLLRGFQVNQNEVLKYSDAVKLIYNMFEAPVLEKNFKGSAQDLKIEYTNSKETALYKFQNIYKITGILDATEFTSRYGESDLGSGKVSIDGQSYNMNNNVSADAYVGMKCDAYVKEEDYGNIVVSIVPDKKIKEISFDAEDFIRYNAINREIGYYGGTSGGKYIEERLSPDVAVIVNGYGLSKFDKSVFEIPNGTIHLYDNDKDDKYDLVVIKEARYFVIDRVVLMSRTIYNKISYTPELKSLVIDERTEDSKINIIKNNKKGTIYDLATNDILEVYYNPSAKKQIIEIIVGGSIVSGYVTGLRSYETVNIDNVTYDFSKSYEIAKENGEKYAPALKFGYDYKFYLNNKKEVIAIDDEEQAEFKAGYLYSTKYVEAEEDEYRVRIFTEDDEWVQYNLAEKVYIDGVRRESERVYEDISIESPAQGSFIRFKINNKNEIVEIEYAKATLSPDDDVFDSTGYINIAYRSSTVPSFETDYYFSSDCKIFYIPEDFNKDEFDIISRSWFKADTYYDVNLHCVNEFNLAKYVLVKATASMTTNRITSGAVMFISDTYTGINEDDMPTTFLEGISGYLTKYSVKFAEGVLERKVVDGTEIYTEDLTHLERGDLIKFVVDSYGDIKYFQVLSKASEKTSYKPDDPLKLYFSSAYVKGTVKKLDVKNYGILLEIDGTKQAIFGNLNTKVFIYNEENDVIYTGTYDDIEENDFIFANTPHGYTQNIVVYKN